MIRVKVGPNGRFSRVINADELARKEGRDTTAVRAEVALGRADSIAVRKNQGSTPGAVGAWARVARWAGGARSRQRMFQDVHQVAQ